MTAFDAAYRDTCCWLEMDSGGGERLLTERWSGTPDTADERILHRCRGSTLDVGCGPGRLTRALVDRGQMALGVDISGEAVRMTVAAGGPAVRASVFERLPGAGRWDHVLLADGNLGIGGDPLALLRRAGELVSNAGTVLVEAHPPGVGLRTGQARLSGGTWFPWAQVGIDAIGTLAAAALLRMTWSAEVHGRWLVELGRSDRVEDGHSRGR